MEVIAAALGVIVGSLINASPVGQAITDQIAEWQEAGDAAYQAEVTKAAAARAKETKGSTPSTPVGAAAGSSRPADPESDNHNRCDYFFESVKDFCEMTNWTARKCSTFSSIVSDCKGDVTRIQVAPHDGDFFFVGCPSSKPTAMLKHFACAANSKA